MFDGAGNTLLTVPLLLIIMSYKLHVSAKNFHSGTNFPVSEYEAATILPYFSVEYYGTELSRDDFFNTL